MSTVRTFAAADYLRFDMPSSIEMDNCATSVVALAYITAFTDFPAFAVWQDAATHTGSYYFIAYWDASFLRWTQNNDSDGSTGLSTSKWYLFGVSKASGTNTPRFHIKNLTDNAAWVHENGSATCANTSTISGPEFQIGDGIAGDLGTVAVWKSNLSDANFESITSLTAISSLSPAGWWILDQADVTTNVVDEIGAAEQNNRSGTSVNSSATIPNFTFTRPAAALTGAMMTTGVGG